VLRLARQARSSRKNSAQPVQLATSTSEAAGTNSRASLWPRPRSAWQATVAATPMENVIRKRVPDDGTPWLAHANCNGRVVRGGSWEDSAVALRSAARTGGDKQDQFYIDGFAYRPKPLRAPLRVHFARPPESFVRLAAGAVERGRQPRLAPWAVPRRDPSEPRPQHPQAAAQRGATQRPWRERQRVRDAGQRAAAARYEGAQTPDGLAPAAARETNCIRRPGRGS
jgi:hypothetical protein